MASIISQVMGSIEKIDYIGKSKKEYREKGLTGIHSFKQKEDCKSTGINFAKWVRSEYGVKKLHQITPEHYKSYIGKLEKDGLSKGHIRNVETSIRLVNHGFNKISSERGYDGVKFTTDERLIAPAERGENVQDRSYSNAEINKVYPKMSKNVQNSVKLMRGLGLRGDEVAKIRAEHIKGDKLVIERGEGITKGGRERIVPIPERLKTDIAKMVEGKEPTDRVIPIERDSIRKGNAKAFDRAGLKTDGRGLHGYRHAYARGRVNELMTDKEQKVLQKALERYGEGKQSDYGVHDKQTYESMKVKMDQIHSELGHGKNRFDLAFRYMN